MGKDSEYMSSEVRNTLEMMDVVQDCLYKCHGEEKAKFLEVSRDFIKVQTRVPTDAMFEEGIHFSTLIMKMLLDMKEVAGVKVIPMPDPRNRGSLILVNIKAGGSHA